MRPSHLCKCSTIDIVVLNSSLSKQITKLQIKHFVTVTGFPSLLILTTVIYHYLWCLMQYCQRYRTVGNSLNILTNTNFIVMYIILLALDELHAKRIKFYS